MRRFLAISIVVCTALMVLVACSTFRKVSCPGAQVVEVRETDTAYIVTIMDDCEKKTVVVAK